MCTMAVDCSRGALLLVSCSQKKRIFHLLLNLESRSGPVSSFAAVTMSVLQVVREVDLELNIYENASKQERKVLCNAEFEKAWATSVGDVRSTSLPGNKVLLEGKIIEYSINKVVMKCRFNLLGTQSLPKKQSTRILLHSTGTSAIPCRDSTSATRETNMSAEGNFEIRQRR